MKDNKASQPEVRQAVTPMRIQQKEFRVSRFGGYKMRDVDEFLDEVTDALSGLMAEAEILRSRSSDPAVVGTPDLNDVSRQADEMIRRARQEAAAIVEAARQEAAASAAASAPRDVMPADRAAVAAFLANEKTFLQNLAGLVQGHAETVKGLVRAGRQAPTDASPQEQQPETAQPESDKPGSDKPEPAVAKQDEPVTLPAAERRVVVDEPQHASVVPTEPQNDATLKELFWGED
jgi:DivIVA domain-containing protein